VHGHSNDWNTGAFGDQNVAYLDFLDLQRQSNSVTLAGTLYNGGTVSQPGEPEYIYYREVSSNLFSVLRVKLAQGRAFLSEDDRIGAAPVAILGYSFWQRHFAGIPQIVGTSLTLDQKSYMIIGIAPAGMQLDGEEPDLYAPLGQDTGKFLRNRKAHPIGTLGRLSPRSTTAQARAELGLIGHHLAQQYPDSNADRTFLVQPLRPEVGDVGPTLWLLLGAVSLVLLIACANIASLLLARAVSREREFAMRAALGASRGRLVRQCLTESAVLGLLGGALGVLLAALGTRPFVAFWPGDLPRGKDVHLDWHVLLFALGVSLLSGLFFGLAPALRAPARKLEQALRAGGRTVVGSSRRLHAIFVTFEVALAVVLLISAGTLGRTLLRLASLDPGVNVRNVLVARMALPPGVLADTGRIRPAWQDVLDRARQVPGVESATIVDTVPLREGNNQLGYWTTADVPPENQQPLTLATCVMPEYLEVMDIPLRQGRFFDERDRMGSGQVVVIDEVMAQQAFGKENPIGKRLWMPTMGPTPYEIVGVVAHVRYWGLASDDQAQVRAQLYYPFSQLPGQLLRRWSELMSIIVRTGTPPLGLVASLRHALRGATGDQVVYQVRTLEQLASNSIAQQRFLLLLFSVFAGLALLLACIGIYGVLAYLTSQRVPEIGLRMALGATARNIMGMVLRQSLGMILAGVGVGVAGALMAARLLKSSVVGVRSIEPLTFAIMICVLVAAALFASFVPAQRASRVDPMSALRQE
jgi:predicted permease